MRLDHAFRLSSYLTLGLACLCLAVAEQFFFPGIYLFLLTILFLLGLAWIIEGRWALPISASNLLGAVIGLGAFAWIGYRTYVVSEEMFEGVPFIAAVLPFLGPLLMILLLVKLLRPKKEGDHWSLQGIGLGHVALGCVLATEPLFGLLLLAYFLSAIWHLLVFYYYRQARMAAKDRESFSYSFKTAWPSAPSLVRGLGWSVLILLVSFPLYVLLPRKAQSAWNPLFLSGTTQTQKATESKVGYSKDIDLNQTGTLEIDDEIAFSVFAGDDQGRPVLDLSSEQRWRGNVLDHYEEGLWFNNSTTFRLTPRNPRKIKEEMDGRHRTAAPAIPVNGLQIQTLETPVLHRGQSFVEFSLRPSKVGGLFLADQGDYAGGRCVFVPSDIVKPGPQEAPTFIEFQNILAIGPIAQRVELHYRQIRISSPEWQIDWRNNLTWSSAHEFLCDYPDSVHEELLTYIEALLQRIKADRRYSIVETDLTPVPVDGRPGVTTVSQSEKVARTLCQYLATSGEFAYSLDRPRGDSQMDPTLDFLVNTKQGHCERFAGALTLMLRSLGIPARIVKGYRGAESHGTGKYDIRQNFAHAWVEILIIQPRPNGKIAYRWVTLDPTPSTSASILAGSSMGRWFKDNHLTPQAFWRELIVNYQADRQQTILADFWKSLVDSRAGASQNSGTLLSWRIIAVGMAGGILIVAVSGGALVALRILRRRKEPVKQPRKSVLAPYYERLIRALAYHADLHPLHGQTPREFAHKASRRLILDQRTQGHAIVPLNVVDMYYQERYGGLPPGVKERNALDAQLIQLEKALAE